MRAKETSPLVAREREVAALTSAIDSLDMGRSVCLGITGELGVGKTRLLGELGDLAGSGRQVLKGRATEVEQNVPFALARDALQPEHAADHASALRTAFESAARRAPLVLLLDDAQWADRASLELFGELLRDPSQPALLVALAYRPRRQLSALRAVPGFERLVEIPARRLSPNQAIELLGDQPARGALYDESLGNPFYLEELAKAAGDPTGSRSAVPKSIIAAIDEELSGLSGDARALLTAAAVIGDPFDIAMAGAVARLPEVEALPALDELVARGLVGPTTSPSRFAFRHPIVRQAVYQCAGEGARIQAHERSAAALAERSGSFEARAHHLERSAAPGDQEAIAVLSRAGRDSAPALAVRWLEAAVRLLPANETERRIDSLVALAAARASVGLLTDARAALFEALELASVGSGPAAGARARGQVVAALARLDHVHGPNANIRAQLEGSLASLGDQCPNVACALRTELAVDHWLAGDFDAATREARQAVQVAYAVEDRAALVEVLALVSLGQRSRGDVGESLRSLDAAGQSIRVLTDSEIQGNQRTFVSLAHAELVSERTANAEQVLRRGLSMADASGHSQWLALLHVYMGFAQVSRGRLVEAEAEAQAAIEAASSDTSTPLAWGWALRSWTARLKGDLPGAIATAERALELTGGAPARFRWLAGCHLGAALLETGEIDRGRGELLAAAGGPDLAEVEPTFRTPWYEILVAGELAAGQVDQAAEWVQRCERSALDFGGTVRGAVALRARAAVMLARGEPTGVVEPAEGATEGFAAGAATLDAARSRFVLGCALRQRGDRRRALRELEQAHQILDQVGALRYRDQVARELRRMGRRIAHRPSPVLARRGIMGLLSERETQVAQLAAAGRTNRGIAEQLFMSEKTVETYLSRAFAKMGVSSRTALGGAIEARSNPVG